MRRWMCIAAMAFASLAQMSLAGDWPAFRGPHGNGLSDEKNVPLHWGKEQNVKWKAKLPGPGNSSPIVWGDRVFLTCAEDEGKKRGLYCFNRADGALRWVRVIEFDKVMPTHKTNPYGATTPVTDGKRVVVWHGSAGLFCYDLEGKELWKRDLGEFRHDWGYAASPIIYRDQVIQNCAPGDHAFVAAFDLATGKDLWRVDEPTDGDGRKRADGSWMGTWSTPVVIQLDGQDQIVCSLPTRVAAYAPGNGEILWTCDGLRSDNGDLAYSSPVIGDGICVAIGGYSGASMAIKLSGRGNITETNRLWRKPRNPQSIGSGVILDGYLYVPDAGPSTIRCLEAATGKEMWADRSSGANHWGSIVFADGRLYVTNQNGATAVFKPDHEKFELLAHNDLQEPSNSTPAISDGQIFIRTFEHLYCIAEQ